METKSWLVGDKVIECTKLLSLPGPETCKEEDKSEMRGRLVGGIPDGSTPLPSRNIAGENAKCFASEGSYQGIEVSATSCYTSDGILLYYDSSSGETTVVKEAKELVRSVDASLLVAPEVTPSIYDFD